MQNNLCPCHKTVAGKLLEYKECCEPLHLGEAKAESPEQLMRSRYSAYYFALGQYIFDTHHADYRGNTSVDEFTVSAKNTRWCGLKIVSKTLDGEQGTVEFKASFIDRDKVHTLHEISNFILEHGHWLYTDGQFQPKTSKKINRNQPCPCGSTKKAKRCCLQ